MSPPPPLSPLDLLLVSLLWTDEKTLTAWSPLRWPHSASVFKRNHALVADELTLNL